MSCRAEEVESVSSRSIVKIVFIIDSLRRHGTQRFLTHLVRGLQHLGYEQSVIVLNNVCDPGLVEELNAANARITIIGKASLLFGGYGWWRLVGLLRQLQPDIVLTMLDFADTLGRPAARLADCPVLVSSIRARNIIKPSWQRRLDRMTVEWARKIIVNSTHVAEYVTQCEGADPVQIAIIANGVEDLQARNQARRNSYREQLKLSPDLVLIGAVSRLERQKNVSLFLRACAALPAVQSWKAVVIGDGAEREKLLHLARDLRLTERVIWLGERDDVEGWLAAMDIFVHTADFEGMPNAVMEAMASALPVVVSAVDGNLELVREGITGYLVPAGEAGTFARRITELMEIPDAARELGQSAHRDVLDRFGMPAMVDAYDHLFSSLVRS